MAKAEHFTYPSVDGKTQIHAMRWRPEGTPTAIVQIVHGMLEFVERYGDFASYLADRGFLVVGNDHLGHGDSITCEEARGYFADKTPDRCVLQDMRELQRLTENEYPNIPYFMLGHSMGSFLARYYLCVYGKHLDGAIISGTGHHPAAEASFGMFLCKQRAKSKGWHYRSGTVNKLVMGNMNKRFEPARTLCDWLTRDQSVVDAYIADARTRFVFTLNAFYGMFHMLHYIADMGNLKKMPTSLPVLFIAGELDPVGNFGAGVKKVLAEFSSVGMKDVQCRIYPNDRHEVLNELDKEDVYHDVEKWLKAHIGKERGLA